MGGWQQYVTYLVFDAPKFDGDFEQRMEFLLTVVSAKLTPYARVVGHIKCKGEDHLKRTLAEVEEVGGEGLMLRRAHSAYEYTRSKCLLKVKSFFDEEARVIGYKQGQGKNLGKMGHLVCETPDKRIFHVGSGFTDQQREHPPKIGAIITYKFFELSAKLHPRFPIFVGVRHDINWDEYCKSYKPPVQKKPAALRRTHTILFSDVSQVAGAPGTTASATSASAAAAAATATASVLVPDPAPPKAASAAASSSALGAAAGSTTTTAAKTAKSRPPCKYGEHCYRRNPEHLAKYSHPDVTAATKKAASKVDVSKLPKGSFITAAGSVYVPIDDKVEPPKVEQASGHGVSPLVSDPQLSPLMAFEDNSGDEENVPPEQLEPKAKKARTEEAPDTRPPCKYGAECHRKNPEHRAKFSHPDDHKPQAAATTTTEAAAAAAAAAAATKESLEAVTMVMSDFTPKKDKKQYKVVLVDTHTSTPYDLEEGVNSIGRGFAGILDPHVSRRQLDIIVATSEFATVPPDVMVVARGVNTSLLLPAGADSSDSSAWRQLARDSPEAVSENDTISLLPNKTATFAIKFVRPE